ncbi:MAG TPA: tetratricopeptide repeat protein [Polyangia bacterium]|nr:tetratricopeptide repeat protein [Polyangia bacterium]
MTAGPLERAWARLARASDRRLSLLLFALAFVVRASYLAQISATEFARVLVGDASAYEAWAREIRRDWIGHEVFYQAPLYPYFLAALDAVFGPSLFVVRLVQAALGGASCVLLAGAGRRLFRSRGVGYGAGLLLALYGPALFFTGLIHKTALDLFFTTAVLYAVARVDETPRRRWLALAGVSLGCLALTRENALAWLPLLAAWFAWRQGPRALVPFLLGAALVLGPVAARNAAVGGRPFITTSQGGVNFYLGNNADTDGTYAPLRFGHGSFAQERQDAIDLAEQAAGRKLAPGEVSSYWSGRALDWISAHPGDWLRLLARKWMLVWNDHEIADSDEPIVYRDASVILRATSLLSFGVLCPLALVGLVATWSARRRVGVLALLLLASAASTAAFLVFARYRAPMIPLLALFAAAGVARLADVARARQTRLLSLYGGLVVAAVVVTRLPFGEEPHPRATARYNLGVTLEGAGDAERAAESYRAAVADAPTFAEARVNLGSLLARGGDLEGAIAQEAEALRLRPDDPTAHTILGNALLQSGRLDDAEAHYRAALRIDPEFPSAKDGLAALQDLRQR